MKKVVKSANAPKPVGPYSQAIIAGHFLFISGQLAIDPLEGKIIAQDVKGQTKQVIKNIKAILEEANYSLNDVIQTSVYLSSMEQFKEFNDEYAKYFNVDSPARATIAVELPLNALVEIAAIAHKE